MHHECPFCGHPIEKSWLFFGVPGGPEYVCPHCHARLKMKGIRYVLNFIIGGGGSAFLMWIGFKTGMNAEWFLVYLPLVLFVFSMAIWFTPGQYQLVKDGYPNKAKEAAKKE